MRTKRAPRNDQHVEAPCFLRCERYAANFHVEKWGNQVREPLLHSQGSYVRKLDRGYLGGEPGFFLINADDDDPAARVRHRSYVRSDLLTVLVERRLELEVGVFCRVDLDET